KNQDHVFAETGDLRFDLRLRAIPDADHRDDRADADDDAERRQRRAQFVSAQRAGRDFEGGSEPDAPRETAWIHKREDRFMSAASGCVSVAPHGSAHKCRAKNLSRPSRSCSTAPRTIPILNRSAKTSSRK